MARSCFVALDPGFRACEGFVGLAVCLLSATAIVVACIATAVVFACRVAGSGRLSEPVGLHQVVGQGLEQDG